MLLLIDNYDSFTWNLAQYFGELGVEPYVVRNDEITPEQVESLAPKCIVVSPGPCTPKEAGVSSATIAKLGRTIPVFGVCLGHQCIGDVFGGDVVRAPQVMHGKTSLIHHTGRGVFEGMPNPFLATRYHSLIVKRDSLPESLSVEAWTDDGLIMGLRHREYPIHGVQFHPESILTTEGKRLLANFLRLAEAMP